MNQKQLQKLHDLAKRMKNGEVMTYDSKELFAELAIQAVSLLVVQSVRIKELKEEIRKKPSIFESIFGGIK